METSYTVKTRKRLDLKVSSRIINVIYGAILIWIGLHIINKESLFLYAMGTILLGCFSLVYGIIGKEILAVHNFIILDSNHLRIKKSFNKAVKLNLDSVTYIKFTPSGIDVTLKDYVKSYDLSWLTFEEFQMFRVKLQLYGNQHNFTVE